MKTFFYSSLFFIGQIFFMFFPCKHALIKQKNFYLDAWGVNIYYNILAPLAVIYFYEFVSNFIKFVQIEFLSNSICNAIVLNKAIKIAFKEVSEMFGIIAQKFFLMTFLLNYGSVTHVLLKDSEHIIIRLFYVLWTLCLNKEIKLKDWLKIFELLFLLFYFFLLFPIIILLFFQHRGWYIPEYNWSIIKILVIGLLLTGLISFFLMHFCILIVIVMKIFIFFYRLLDEIFGFVLFSYIILIFLVMVYTLISLKNKKK